MARGTPRHRETHRPTGPDRGALTWTSPTRPCQPLRPLEHPWGHRQPHLDWSQRASLPHRPPAPRPQHFAPQPGQFDPAFAALGPIGAAYGCPHPATQILFNFIDHERKFQFEVIAGPGASTAQTYRILDSLQIKTPAQLHRAPSPIVSVPTVLVPFAAPPRPQDVRVFVLNASNRPGIETTTANRLRNLGYTIAGTQAGTIPTRAFTDRSGQSVTITSCRPGFSQIGAGNLAEVAIGRGTVLEDPTLAAFFQSHNSDCLVVIGQADNATIPNS